MSIERNLIISILKLTKNGSVSNELVKIDAKLPEKVAENLFRKMQTEGLLYLRDNTIHVEGRQRLEMLARTVRLGADVESVASLLQWKEFEEVTADVLRHIDYTVTRNFRFKHLGKRWEIDIVACKKPIALCIDCKHWHRTMHPSATRRIAHEQVERTRAFADSLPNPIAKNLECSSWKNITLIPAVLSLVPTRSKFSDDVPIVPVLQIQDFLNQLPAYVNSVKHFRRSLTAELNR
jgi:Holliday junction resolvase-like predicted endonuclease